MSVTAGNFTETRILQQRYIADQLLLDGRVKQQYIPKMQVFNYINSLQTAQLNNALNAKAKKQYEVEISWLNACSDFSIDDTSCAIGGNEPSTNTVTYELTKRIVKGFSVNDAKFRDNEYDSDEAIAKTLLQIDKQITEEFSQYLVGRLDAFAGVNQVTNGKGVINPIDDTITDIAPANWTAEIMAYFNRVVQLNRFSNPAMISGSNLYETLFIAMANNANAEGKGDYILWNGLPIWFDLFNVDSVMTPDLYTFLVEQGSIAIANKAFNPDSAFTSFSDVRYTLPSRFMPGMTYDVFYNNNCNSSESDYGSGKDFNKDTLKHNWKVVFTADMFKNPFGCDAIEDGGVQTGGENSGILKFRNYDPEAVVTPTPTV